MSNTASAITAAKEVNAPLLAPELYRQSRELFFKAKKAYRFKYFTEAYRYSKKARKFAERAELEAIINGAIRTSAPTDSDEHLLEVSDSDIESDSFESETEEKSEEDEFESPEKSIFFESYQEDKKTKQ